MAIQNENGGLRCLLEYPDVVCHVNVSFISVTEAAGKVRVRFNVKLYEADSKANPVNATPPLFSCVGGGYPQWTDTFALIANLCGAANVSQFVRAVDLWLLTVKACFLGSRSSVESYSLYFKVRHQGTVPHLVLQKVRLSESKLFKSRNNSGFALVVSEKGSRTYNRLNVLAIH